ncbi:hypothetical protein SVIOM74S_01078 [Streptomyces violarus]
MQVGDEGALSLVGVRVVCNFTVPRTRWAVAYFSDCHTAAQRRGSSGMEAIGKLGHLVEDAGQEDDPRPSAPEFTLVRIVVVPARSIFSVRRGDRLPVGVALEPALWSGT